MTNRSHSLLVVAAAALWGTTGTAQALAPPEAQPLAVGAVRISLGGAALVLFALLTGGLSRGKAVGGAFSGGWSRGAVAAAALGVALYQPLFFAGVAAAGVSVGTVVAIGSAPVMAGIVGFAALGERPGRRWALATALAVAGCALLVGGESGEAGALGVCARWVRGSATGPTPRRARCCSTGGSPAPRSWRRPSGSAARCSRRLSCSRTPAG